MYNLIEVPRHAIGHVACRKLSQRVSAGESDTQGYRLYHLGKNTHPSESG